MELDLTSLAILAEIFAAQSQKADILEYHFFILTYIESSGTRIELTK